MSERGYVDGVCLQERRVCVCVVTLGADRRVKGRRTSTARDAPVIVARRV